MKIFSVVLLSAVYILGVGGCATGPKVVDRIQVGMDKDQVLRELGNPQQTYRRHGKDHWIYSFHESDQELIRTVSFANGQVVRVGATQPKVSLEQELDSSDSMEEFENKVRRRKRR